MTVTAKPEVAALKPYQPGKPIDELARETGLAENDIIKLASNESPLGPSPLVTKRLFTATQIFSDLDNQALARYPDGNGYRLKCALREHTGCDVDQMTLGNGSNDVLAQIAQAFLQPGDEAWFSEHSFAVYRLVVQQCGGVGREIAAKNFGHDLAQFIATLSERPAPKLIFLANPNNPTGSCFTQSELEPLLQAVPNTTLVVLDEAYAEYVKPTAAAGSIGFDDYPCGIQLMKQYPNVMVTRTFSKAYGLAGLRVGYGLSSAEVADDLNRVRQPFNVNELGLRAAELCLEDADHLSRAVKHNSDELNTMNQWADHHNLSYIDSVANFVTLDVGDGVQVYERLLKKGVITRSIADYGLPKHLRVSLGLTHENAFFRDQLIDVLSELTP